MGNNQQIGYMDELILEGNKPWRIMVTQEGLCPAHLEIRLANSVYLGEKVGSRVRSDLAEYRAEIEKVVQNAIQDKRLDSVTDVKSEIDRLWKLPVMLKRDLKTYYK